MKSKCKECCHYDFYKMITSGPYSYSGEIPCNRCVHFSFVEDNFEPIAKNKDIPDFLTGRLFTIKYF